jgi:hypothetical protein
MGAGTYSTETASTMPVASVTYTKRRGVRSSLGRKITWLCRPFRGFPLRLHFPEGIAPNASPIGTPSGMASSAYFVQSGDDDGGNEVEGACAIDSSATPDDASETTRSHP